MKTNNPDSSEVTIQALGEPYVFWVVSAFSLIALCLAVYRMNKGFGPQNLRVFGIVLVASLVAMLASANGSELSTAMGILGAIAGYLFGSQRDNEPASENFVGEKSSVDAGNANFGDYAKIAGRDINETLQKIRGNIENLKDSIVHMESSSAEKVQRDVLFISNYFEDGEPLERIAHDAQSLRSGNWSMRTVFPSFDKRGFVAVFTRPAVGEFPAYFHGIDVVEIG